MARIAVGSIDCDLKRHRGAHPLHLFLQPRLLPAGVEGSRAEASICVKGPRPLAPHTAPALWGSARQGEGTAVSIYLTGPHSPSHGREGSGGRNTTPRSPRENLRVPGALERAAWGGGTGPS